MGFEGDWFEASHFYELGKSNMSEKKMFKVLLVSDDLEAVSLIKEVLSGKSIFYVHHTDSLKSGVDFLKENRHFDLYIIDEFSGIHGHAFLNYRADNPQFNKLPLLYLTEEVTFSKLLTLKNLYVGNVLLKPLKANMLYAKIESILHLGAHYTIEVVEKLRKIAFFKHFALNELYQILESGYINQFLPEQILIREKGIIDKFGVLLQGVVGIMMVEGNNPPVLVNELKRGHFLGETNLLTRKESQVRVVCQETTMVFMLPYFAFHLLPDSLQTKLLRLITRGLGEKLNKMNQLLYLQKKDHQQLVASLKNEMGIIVKP